jgi:hypothetical protein
MGTKWVNPTSDGKGKKFKLYNVWLHMMQRCNNPNDKGYKWYGARGITVCDEWLSYDNFCEWAYSSGYDNAKTGKDQSLDRIDPSRNYEPSNCRWVSMKTQTRNKRNTIRINGTPLADLAEGSGAPNRTIYERYQRGIDTVEDLLSDKKLTCTIFVEGKTLPEISKEYSVPYGRLKWRYRNGARTIEELTRVKNSRISKLREVKEP